MFSTKETIRKQNSSRIILLILLCALSLCLFAGCAEKETQDGYVLYVGLNDAESGTQLLTVEEAQKIARKVFTDNGFGYTERVAYGAYVDNGNVISNDTLVYDVFFIEKEDITWVAGEIKSQLKIASVLIEELQCFCYFAE